MKRKKKAGAQTRSLKYKYFVDNDGPAGQEVLYFFLLWNMDNDDDRRGENAFIFCRIFRNS